MVAELKGFTVTNVETSVMFWLRLSSVASALCTGADSENTAVKWSWLWAHRVTAQSSQQVFWWRPSLAVCWPRTYWPHTFTDHTHTDHTYLPHILTTHWPYIHKHCSITASLHVNGGGVGNTIERTLASFPESECIIVSKDTLSLKLCSYKILQFLVGRVCQLTQCVPGESALVSCIFDREWWLMQTFVLLKAFRDTSWSRHLLNVFLSSFTVWLQIERMLPVCHLSNVGTRWNAVM